MNVMTQTDDDGNVWMAIGFDPETASVLWVPQDTVVVPVPLVPDATTEEGPA